MIGAFLAAASSSNCFGGSSSEEAPPSAAAASVAAPKPPEPVAEGLSADAIEDFAAAAAQAELVKFTTPGKTHAPEYVFFFPESTSLPSVSFK